MINQIEQITASKIFKEYILWIPKNEREYYTKKDLYCYNSIFFNDKKYVDKLLEYTVQVDDKLKERYNNNLGLIENNGWNVIFYKKDIYKDVIFTINDVIFINVFDINEDMLERLYYCRVKSLQYTNLKKWIEYIEETNVKIVYNYIEMKDDKINKYRDTSRYFLRNYYIIKNDEYEIIEKIVENDKDKYSPYYETYYQNIFTLEETLTTDVNPFDIIL